MGDVGGGQQLLRDDLLLSACVHGWSRVQPWLGGLLNQRGRGGGRGGLGGGRELLRGDLLLLAQGDGHGRGGGGGKGVGGRRERVVNELLLLPACVHGWSRVQRWLGGLLGQSGRGGGRRALDAAESCCDLAEA